MTQSTLSPSPMSDADTIAQALCIGRDAMVAIAAPEGALACIERGRAALVRIQMAAAAAGVVLEKFCKTADGRPRLGQTVLGWYPAEQLLRLVIYLNVRWLEYPVGGDVAVPAAWLTLPILDGE